MKKAIYFLLLISIAIVLLFTGCGRAKTFSDYRQNWNDFAKETVKTNQTTLSENMLLFPASEPIKLKNGGKKYEVMLGNITGTENRVVVFTDKSDRLVSLKMFSRVVTTDESVAQSDFQYALLINQYAILSMKSNDSDKAFRRLFGTNMIHLQNLLGVNRSYIDESGTRYELKVTGGDANFNGFGWGMNDIYFQLTITAKIE